MRPLLPLWRAVPLAIPLALSKGGVKISHPPRLERFRPRLRKRTTSAQLSCWIPLMAACCDARPSGGRAPNMHLLFLALPDRRCLKLDVIPIALSSFGGPTPVNHPLSKRIRCGGGQ
jgi:hypothetical protein